MNPEPQNPRLLEEQGKVLILFARHCQAVGDLKAADAAAVTRSRRRNVSATMAWKAAAPSVCRWTKSQRRSSWLCHLLAQS